MAADQKKASDVIIEKLDKSLNKIESNLTGKLEKVEERMHQIELTAVRHNGCLEEHMRRSDSIERLVAVVEKRSEEEIKKLQEKNEKVLARVASAEAFQNKVLGAVLILTPVATWALNHFIK
jgi:hypothetical protein